MEHFQEMIDLDDYILNITAPKKMADKLVSDRAPTFYDLCEKRNITDEIVVQIAAGLCETDERACLPDILPKCHVSARPIDFVYDRKTDTFDLAQFRNDNELIARI